MIENLQEMIEKEDGQGFKDAFSQSILNSHQKELLYELSYRKQITEIYEFMESRTNLSQERKINVFLKTLQDGVKIKNFNTVKVLNDLLLSQKMKLSIEDMAKSQDDDFLKNFINAHPITSFLNFNKIIFTCFKYDHHDFIEYISKKNLNKGHIFYSGICAIKFNKKEIFSTFLLNLMKNNPEVLDDIKKLKNEYLILMKNKVSNEEKEECESFINSSLIETFAKYLDEELEQKNSFNANPIKSKRMKI